MPKICPEGKVLNPLTNRCVSKKSAIGKKILKFTERPNAAMERNTALPVDVIDTIVSFLPEQHQNCGQLIRFLRNTNTNIQTLSPELRAQLRSSVVKTLTVFMKRVQKTSLIKLSAMHPQNQPMMRRIKYTIALARRTTDVSVLVNYCKKIVEWKQESQQILQQLHNILGYMDTYRKTRVPQPNYMGNLVVFVNTHSLQKHRIHRVNAWPPLDAAYFKQAVSRVLYAERKKVQKDQQKLVDILKPVDINE